MTTQELQSVLLSIADTLDEGKNIFPLGLDQELVTLLSNLDPTSSKLIATLLNMPAVDFEALVPNIINLLKAAENLFATGESDKISGVCRSLANRPFVLAIISRFL